jgi:hypothetical protein
MSSSPLTITLDRRLLEHPEALHLRRMRGAIWLYLALLARLPRGADSLEVAPSDLARTMGLPEGTVRSWLGHLRKHHYAEILRLNGSVRVRVKHVPAGDRPSQTPAPAPTRFFTVPKLEAALGETGNRDVLEGALAAHPDPVIRRALAGALAVRASEIRRSRTALFIYLLKRHAQNHPDPRP